MHGALPNALRLCHCSACISSALSTGDAADFVIRALSIYYSNGQPSLNEASICVRPNYITLRRSPSRSPVMRRRYPSSTLDTARSSFAAPPPAVWPRPLCVHLQLTWSLRSRCRSTRTAHALPALVAFGCNQHPLGVDLDARR